MAKPGSGNLEVLKAVRLVELGFSSCLADGTQEVLLPQINNYLRPIFSKFGVFLRALRRSKARGKVSTYGQRAKFVYL